MSTYKDAEMGMSDEENYMELADLKHILQPWQSSSNLANGHVNSDTSERNESEEPKDELQKQWEKNTRLLEAIFAHNNMDVISLLKNGASPNATSHVTLTSACHIAASFNAEALRILLDAGAERRRFDNMGNTPLHYAAWANAPKTLAIILGFPEGLTNEILKVNHTLTPEQEAEIQEIGDRINGSVDANGAKVFPSAFESALPEEWMTDNDVRNFRYYPRLEHGCSALHVASMAANPQCVRLLLAAGADPNLRDENNSTPLDVAGALSSDDNVQSYLETLQLLRNYGGRLNTVQSPVLERALHKHNLQALKLLLNAGAPINHRNRSGYTPMHLCVELRLKEYLEVLANHSSPEMNYRAVNVTDKEGSTVLHWAARERWSDGVTVALLAKVDIIHKNSVGDTALHLAAKAGDYDIVKEILNHDTNGECDFSTINVKGEFPFFNAILSGNADIVRLMLDLNNDMRDYLHKKIGNLTPLEYATEKKFQELFILILNEQNELLDRDETSRIVNIIAKHNLWKLFSELKKKQSKISSLKEIISKDYILHEAIKHGSREMIIILLGKGADLSQKNDDGQTAISLLMYHVTKPTEFMTEVLNECIKTDKNIYDKDCVITINYSVLMPVNEYEEIDGGSDSLNTKSKDMKVLEALIETGDVYDQRSLLTHPVVESFLYLKWKKWTKFCNFLITAYVLFLISFNTFIATVYYHMDHKIKEQDIIFVFDQTFWRNFAFVTFCPISLVELYFLTSSQTKWLDLTKLVKSVLIVGGVTMIFIPMDTLYYEDFRYIAALTVLLSWINMMFYLTWTFKLNSYLQFYDDVSNHVLEVLQSFAFPIVGFSMSFMILLRSKEPFDGPIAAIFKTIVMMSSEFDYENLIKNTMIGSLEDAKNRTINSSEVGVIVYCSVLLIRLFFLLFLVSGAILLMDVMVDFAVSDLQESSRDSKQQRRLRQQVKRLTALEKLVQQRPFSTFKWTRKETMKVPSKLEVKLDSKTFDKEMNEIILNKVRRLKETDKTADDVDMKAKIDDIFEITKKLSEIIDKLLYI